MVANEELETVAWDKIIDLFDSKYTCEIYSRQLDALEQIFQQRQSGALVMEFEYLAILLERCLVRALNQREEFVIPCINLMTIMGMPFLRERSFEEVKNREFLVQALRVIASPFSSELAVETRYPELVKAAARSLSLFLDPNRGFSLDLGTIKGRSIPLAYDNNLNFLLLSESGIIPVIVDCLRRCCYTVQKKAYELCLVLVRLCRDMAFSTCCAEIVVNSGIDEIVP